MPLRAFLGALNSLEAHNKSLKSHYWPRIFEADQGWELKQQQSTDSTPVLLFLYHTSPTGTDSITHTHLVSVHRSPQGTRDGWINTPAESLSQPPNSLWLVPVQLLGHIRCQDLRVLQLYLFVMYCYGKSMLLSTWSNCSYMFWHGVTVERFAP